MATAVRRAKRRTNTATQHRSTVRNPSTSGRRLLVGGRRKTTAAPRRRRRRTNPASMALVKRATARRTSYRRNPSDNTSDLIFAFGGALAINAFDYAINRIAPSISAPLRIGGKVAAGWAFGQYGKKVPVIGNFAPVIRKALYLAAALDAFAVWVAPMVAGWLGSVSAPAAITGQQQVQNTATGEMGMRYHLQDGSAFDVFDQQNDFAYA